MTLVKLRDSVDDVDYHKKADTNPFKMMIRNTNGCFFIISGGNYCGYYGLVTTKTTTTTVSQSLPSISY
jgi:hypothetical protein